MRSRILVAASGLLVTVALAITPLGFHSPTIPNLVGWWTFNEGSGTTSTADLSGYGNTGFLTNSPVWTNGVIGSGLYFQSNLVNIPNTQLLNFDKTNGFTLAAWVRTTNAAVDTFGVIAKYTEATSVGYFMAINGGTVYFQIQTDNTPKYKYRLGGTNVTNGSWHLLAATSSGSGTTNGMSVWVDGNLDIGGSSAEQGTLGGITTAQPIKIGNRLKYLTNSAVDDVRIYNTNLSAAQIKQLYNSTSGSQR